jgi:hypothetical protein
MKIEKYLFYLIKNDKSSLLSGTEFDFAKNLFKIKRKYLNENLYKRINSSYNDFTNAGINIDIVQGPPEKFYNIIKSNTNEADNFVMKDYYEDSNETVTIHKDDIICLPFFLVKEKIEDNQFQII